MGKKKVMYNNYFQNFPIFPIFFFSYVIFLKHFFTNVYSSMLPGVLFRFVSKEPISIDTSFYCVFNEEFSLQRLLLRLYVLKMTVLVCLL